MAKADNLKAKVEIVEKMLTIGLIDKPAALALLTEDLNDNFEGGAAIAVPPDLNPILKELEMVLETGDLASAAELVSEARSLLGQVLTSEATVAS